MKLTKSHLISLIKEVLKETEYTEKGHWGKEASGLLLTTGEKVLLLLRSGHVTEPHTWGIPGGAVEKGEDPLQSAMREAEEEMQLSIDSYRNIGNTVFQDDEDGFKYTTFILRVVEEMEYERIKLDWENDDYKWVDQDWIEDNAHLLHSGVLYTLEQKWNVIFDSDYL
jgi:8-oxo-dGTP diphosphatase